MTLPAAAPDHRQLRQHVVLNGMGWLVPAILALAAVPALARLLGADRFGLLTLAWAAVSAFAILDLGLGRALSVLVADRRARGQHEEIAGLVRAAGVTSWMVFAPLGVLLALAAPWIVAQGLDLPSELTAEALRSLRTLALALPIVVHGIVLRAAFEGDLRFGAVNALRIPLGVVTWGGPWIAAVFTRDVSVLALVIVAGRTAYWAAQLLLLARGTAPAAATPLAATPRAAATSAPAPSQSALATSATSPYAALWATGSWITLSGLLSPVLTTLDRFVVPLLVPIAAVGWYVAAGEGATKLWLFPAALGPVLVPALAAAFARGDSAEARALLLKATRATGAVLIGPVVVLALWADPILRWWLADAFAPDVVRVFTGFVIAVFFNSVAQVAYAGLQAGGEAKSAALLHLAEVPVFIGLLVWFGQTYGATGAAMVWAGRLVLDAFLMMALAVRRIGLPRSEVLLWSGATLVLLLVMLR